MTSTRISSLDSLHLLQSFVSAVGNWSGSHDINILLNIMCQGQQLVQASYSLHSLKTDILRGTSVSEKTDTLASIDAPPVVLDEIALAHACSRMLRCRSTRASARALPSNAPERVHCAPSERDREKKNRARPAQRARPEKRSSPTGTNRQNKPNRLTVPCKNIRDLCVSC